MYNLDTMEVVMTLSYSRLWKLLIDRQISRPEFRRLVGLAPNTMTKLYRNDEVALSVLCRICQQLGVDIGDIVEYLPSNTAKNCAIKK